MKKLFKYVDVPLLVLATLTSLFGLITIYSATHTFGNPFRFVFVQAASFVVAFIATLIISHTHYKSIFKKWIWLYAIIICLLLAVLFFGSGEEETGVVRWLRIGSFAFQPSEIVKVLFIITFARHLSILKDRINTLVGFLSIFAHAAIPIILIGLQPDAGTALAFMFIFAVMVFMAGLNWKFILGLVTSGIALLPIAYFFILKEYQKIRIINFFNPEQDVSGAGYQVTQSKIAVGGGGVFGQGFINGNLTQNSLLPAKHTDFIFSVVCEEFGFIGALLIVCLFTAIIIRIFWLSRQNKGNFALSSEEVFGNYIKMSVGALLLFHVAENILMVLGLMPVTGIPLPLISYGGTSALSFFLAIGLASNKE